jgi:hypothetical protein
MAFIATTSHPQLSWAQEYTAEQAPAHIGQTATVCGRVVSPKFALKSKGQPTFLNLDRPFPNHIFTVVIWSTDRSKFGQPEIDLANKRICAHGLIVLFKGRPEIIARDSSQITVDR